jgi:hypothetical protein
VIEKVGTMTIVVNTFYYVLKGSLACLMIEDLPIYWQNPAGYAS